jgi:hypothetical protein
VCFRSERGASNIIVTAWLLPLVALIAFGGVMYSHVPDIANVKEEAARAAARWLATHPGDAVVARQKAADVILGSFLPNNAASFSAKKDVTFLESDGYVYCSVTYHYQVPLKNIFTLVKGDQAPSSWDVLGRAVFKAGEL